MKGSLSQAVNFKDVDLRVFATGVAFVPENIQLEEYTFLPYVRTGLAAALVPPTGTKLRATVPVRVTVKDDEGRSEDVTRTVTLRGPGDVINLEAAQIVRREPTPNARNVEDTFLAHIEFDRPELPWLFSPEAPENSRLRPWLVLVVVDAAVSSIEPGPAELPARLRTRRGELPPLDDSWAWGHAQVIGKKTGTPTVEQRLGNSHTATNLSRLICPRKLDERRNYIAALVPAYDAGVRAGLGLSGGTLGPAWTRAANGSDAEAEVVLPAYDTWRFGTGEAGDFEELARKLEGIVAPWNVGRRIIDASNPRGGMGALEPDEDGRLQVLRCALYSPAPLPADAPSEAGAWTDERREQLRALLNEPAQGSEPDDLPHVGPRIYARWQRASATVGGTSDAKWFEQLNTSPLHRIVAGLGTRVVQKDQEQLMQAAWLQVGEIDAANTLLTRLQFGRYVSDALHRNHLERLGLGELSQVTRAVQDKVRFGGAALTVRGTVRHSATAPAAMTSTFRRMTRVRGPLARLAGPAAAAALRTMVGSDGRGFTDFRRQYVEPDGVGGLSPAAIAAIPTELVARKLGVPEARATQTLTQRLTPPRGELTVADRLLAPVATWQVQPGTIDLGSYVAERISQQVELAVPTRHASEPARAEAVASLLVGIGNSDVPEVSRRANDTVGRIGERLADVTVRDDPRFGPQVVRAGDTIRGGVADTPTSGRLPLDNVVRPFGGGLQPRVTGTVVRPAPAPAPAPQRVPAARLRFETAASREISAQLKAGRTLTRQTAAAAFSTLVRENGVLDMPPTPDRPLLNLAKGTLLDAIAPAATLSAYARSRLKTLPHWLPDTWFDNGRIDRIMAAPRFDRPMYEALDAYDRDWLVPGLGSIEATDFVTVLVTNPVFTETFLVGLSDEMGRELLWRDYPTDQRGTYFYRFWDAQADELARQIHRFPADSALGNHLHQGVGGAEGRVVLVVRGELVQRYPDTIILAMRAGGRDADGRPQFGSAMARVLFHAQLPPDLLLVGFDLTAAQVRGGNWWFIIAEHPSAPRFGLDSVTDDDNPAAPPGTKRNDLDWNDLGRLQFDRFLWPSARGLDVTNTNGDPTVLRWPQTSAMVAGTLLQNPVRAAFDAKKLIGSLLST